MKLSLLVHYFNSWQHFSEVELSQSWKVVFHILLVVRDNDIDFSFGRPEMQKRIVLFAAKHGKLYLTVITVHFSRWKVQLSIDVSDVIVLCWREVPDIVYS